MTARVIEEDRIFEEMTKKAMVALFNDEVYLTCEDHPQIPLQEHFDEGYLTCEVCGWCITLRQARTMVNDILTNISALFDLLNEEIEQREEIVAIVA